MATVVSQHACHLGHQFYFVLFCAKLQQILLKLVKNVYFKYKYN